MSRYFNVDLTIEVDEDRYDEDGAEALLRGVLEAHQILDPVLVQKVEEVNDQ